jgi:hypothetical protein
MDPASSPVALVIIALAAFSGNIVSGVIVVVLNQRNATKAQVATAAAAQAAADAATAAIKVAEAARLATLKAQEAASIAQSQALDAAKQLVEAAKSSNEKLQGIADVGNATHKIVNSERTATLKLVAALWKRISAENPQDSEAKEAANESEQNARLSTLVNKPNV